MIRVGRAALAALTVVALLAGITGGLARVGYAVLGAPMLAQNAGSYHAPLMMSAFFGTVIATERAVALKHPTAFAVPVGSSLGGIFLLLGSPATGSWLGVIAGALFIWVNSAIVAKQRAAHTTLLLVSACAWAIGNLVFAITGTSAQSLPWWFAFLIITIAAERLEMTRLMRRVPWSQYALFGIITLMLAGATTIWFSPRWGGLAFGASFFLLATWLIAFDIARRTVQTVGLSRYMAVCLLSGYVWLRIGGIAWAGLAVHALPSRDLALHALGLGFIFSMIMGHAPVILPAIARIRIPYSPFLYLPLAALHASLLIRLGGGFFHWSVKMQGAALNAWALLLFAITMAASAIYGKRRH